MLKFHKVTSLPGTLEADAFYFVENGTFAESYLTDSAGTAHSIGNSAMIQSIADARVASGLATANRVEIVADIAARDALATADLNQMVLVEDASADATVDSGSALYVFRNSDNTWTKVAEYESLEVSYSWSAIQGGPTSSPTLIDDAVTKRHTHTNKAVLDALSDVSGELNYNGTPVGGSGGTVDWNTVNW